MSPLNKYQFFVGGKFHKSVRIDHNNVPQIHISFVLHNVKQQLFCLHLQLH